MNDKENAAKYQESMDKAAAYVAQHTEEYPKGYIEIEFGRANSL